MASSIGLGIALACPGKGILAIEGDGAVLMNLGTLATIADQGPDNYLLTIIDNGVYGSTGGQPTCAARRADLASIARGQGCGMYGPRAPRPSWNRPSRRWAQVF